MYRILIVEDEDAAAELLKHAVETYGAEQGERFQVVRMASAIGLDELVSKDFDLIFLDIELPGQNGMDAAFDLRAHDTSTPIIFVTNMANYAVHGYAVNALDFIVKPFTYEDFHLRMDRAMQVMLMRMRRTLSVRSRDGMRMFDAGDLVFIDMDGTIWSTTCPMGRVSRYADRCASLRTSLAAIRFCVSRAAASST